MTDLTKYRHIPFTDRNHCLVCGNNSWDVSIEMPRFPMTEIYTEQKCQEGLGYVDQAFDFCTRCGHGQLRNVIDPEFQYGDASSYFFRASDSISGRASAHFLLRFIERISKGKNIKTAVEIGCNDLYLLKSLGPGVDRRIGIDPILKGKEAVAAKDDIIAMGDFLENVTLDPDVDLVICKDTLEHVKNPREFIQRIVKRVSEQTVMVFQFPLLEPLLNDCRFDHVFHQHVNYFSMKSLLYLLENLGCTLLTWDINHDHWGSIAIAVQKNGGRKTEAQPVWQISPRDVTGRHASFRRDMELTGERLSYFSKEKIYGYGAALMFPVLCYHLGTDLTELDCIIDDDAKKDGLYYINSPIPIRHRRHITDMEDAVVLLTAPFSKVTTRQLLANLIQMKPRHMICPLKSI